MSHHVPTDPGKVNAWKASVAKGVRRAQRTCPKCERKSGGGLRVVPAERLAFWTCRYCNHCVAHPL